MAAEAAPAALSALVARQRAARPRLAALDWRARRARVLRLRDALLANRAAIAAALEKDLGRHPVEADLADVFPVVSEANHAARHLRRWMRSRDVPAPLTQLGTRTVIHPQPKGCALIMAPWNYPFTLTLGPLVSALAAGCTAVIKPSEHAPASGAALRELLAPCFPDDEVAVVEGGVEVSRALLAEPFDHIFFTGSPRIGREVLRAAAATLASVTLELGGKSPAIVDASADPREAARKIAWGKCLNAGQTCIAPDYALVAAPLLPRFLAELKDALGGFYGADPRRSPDYARMVNETQRARLAGWLAEAVAGGANVVAGGETDAEGRYFAPTVVTGLPAGTPLLEEEIFGPILPVVPFAELDEALAFVNARPNPLALYHFSRDERAIARVRDGTRAGNSVVNDTVVHFFAPELPFGGAGFSGFGDAHGRHGFEAFSRMRGEARPLTRFSPVQLTWPPFTGRVRRVVDWMIRWLA